MQEPSFVLLGGLDLSAAATAAAMEAAASGVERTALAASCRPSGRRPYRRSFRRRC